MSGQLPTFNIKAVTLETGLTPATLRAWERRYGLFKPQRSPGGQRLYTQNEMDMLKWLVARQEEGLSISRAVEMWRSREKSAAELSQFGLTPEQVTTIPDGITILDQLREKWLSACMNFDEPAAEQSLTQALTIAAPEVFCTEILQKGLAELGERWYAGTVSVQQEHFASALAARRLNSLFAATPIPTHPGRLLAACPPGEAHDLSLLMLAFILRWRGWEVIYLGANVPLAHLDDTLRSTAPSMLITVAQTLPGAAALNEMASYANNRFVPLAYGGGIFKHIPGLTEHIPGYFLGDRMIAAPQVIDHLLTYRPALPVLHPLQPAYMATLALFKEKEALIVQSVNVALQNGPIAPSHLEEANINLTRSIASALALGEIGFLNYSVGWLKGLLENYGLSPALADQYYSTYRQAVQQHLGDQASIISDWLAQFQLVL